jgi:hypothetical protein
MNNFRINPGDRVRVLRGKRVRMLLKALGLPESLAGRTGYAQGEQAGGYTVVRMVGRRGLYYIYNACLNRVTKEITTLIDRSNDTRRLRHH